MSDPRLPGEPQSWPLAALEARVIQLLLEGYGNEPKLIENVRMRGAAAISRIPPEIGGLKDFSIPMVDGGFWLIRPKDRTEEQCLEFLIKVRQIRDAIREGDVWAATALAWMSQHDLTIFEIETLYGEPIRISRERRDEILTAQIRDWLAENPRLKNTQIARQLQADPQYAPMVSNIKDLRLFVGRLRKKNSMC